MSAAVPGGARPDTVRAGAPATRSGAPRRFSVPLTVGMLAVTAYFLLPLLWMVIASTKSNADLFSTFGYWFGEMNLLENVRDVFSFNGGVYGRWLANTIVYAVVASLAGAITATLAGYGFAKFRFRGSTGLFGSILAVIMVPGTALVIPLYLLFAEIGLTNTPWAVILPCAVSPFGVYLMKVFAQDAIPDSLIEAARVDGAGEARIFLQVGLRLLAPGFVTVVLFILVATWNNFFLPLIMLSSQQLYPLTVGLTQWQAAATSGSGSQALFSMVITGATISVVPLVVAFLFLQRYWQSGLATGGVKQ